MSTRVFYCNCCHKETVHNLVDYRSALRQSSELFRPMQGILQIPRFDIAELTNHAMTSPIYQCQSCGNIVKK